MTVDFFKDYSNFSNYKVTLWEELQSMVKCSAIEITLVPKFAHE